VQNSNQPKENINMLKKIILPILALTCLAVPAARADFSSSVQALQPLAYWPLSETVQPPPPTGVTSFNLGTIGSGYDANPSGDVVFGYQGAIAGTTDTADSFNGFNTRIIAPAAAPSSASFTVEAWLLAHDDGTLWGTTCPVSDVNANNPRSGWLIYMDVANVGQYTFRAYSQNGTSASLSLDLGPPGSIQVEKWYHVVVVVSNAVTATNVYGFVNGALVAGPTVLPAYVPNDGAAGNFNIAGRSDGDGFDFTGAIDEVAYYTNALSAATVLAHYQAGTNPSPATAYTTLVQQANPLLYYRMHEVATPLSSPYPAVLPVAANLGSLGTSAKGYYQPNTVPGIAGPTNAGFGANSKACAFSTNGTQSSTISGPGVMCDPYNQAALNIHGGLTLAAWVRVPAFPVGWFQTPIGRGDASYRFDVDPGGLPHFAAAPNGDVIGSVPLNDGAWHFWTGVFDPVAGKSLLYIDSLLAAQGSSSALADLSCYLLLGGAPDYLDRNFFGDLCHVAVFSNALSVAQITNLYNSALVAPVIYLPTNGITVNEGATATLTASVSGTPTLSFKWYVITTGNVTNPVAGQTTPTLSLSNVSASQNGNNYFLVASNAYGVATSSNVLLTVVQGPPTILVDVTPAAQSLPVGVTASYSIQVSGTLPFHYQWIRDGSAVAGATTSAYSFPVLSGSHTYSVTVTNNFGSVNSVTSTLTGIATPPPVITFNTTGTDWTINNNNSPNAAITNGTLLLTDGANSEVASAFYNTPQYDGGFAAFFTYQEADGSAPLADGATFCIQNSPAGASALGGGGGELGFYGIGNSAALELNIYTGSSGGRGIQFGTNGATPASPSPTPPYFSCAPVNLASAHPINVRLFYSQGVVSVKLVDATTGDSFLTSQNIGDLRGIIGSDSAYVGFTAATGGLNAIQTISNFRFSYSTAPVLSVVRSGSNVVITWPVSVATFFVLQQSPTVNGPWTTVGTPPTVVGGQEQVTLPATGTAQFYRLLLQ
jgi:hypothetical protein